MSEKKKKENDVDAGAAASGARKAPEHKRRAAGASRSGANARAARQQRTDGTDTAAAKTSKPRNAFGQRKTGGRRTKAERSSLFDFPDITPDDVVNAAADTPETAVSSRSAQNAAKGRRSGTRDASDRKTETKLRIIPLGGLGEIGKNMTAFEFGSDIVVIDCGMGFPEEDMPGVDLVIPDISYLTANREKVRGILLTHGHEDHIGAVPYVLKQLNVPVYGTALTLGIIKNKLSEHRLDFKPQLITVKAGDKVKLGVFEAEFIHVNHSIADSCAIALTTPRGVVVHSGDFKLDVTPIEGEMMDLTRFGELGKKGVKLLMCESTNAERSGFTPSERSVGGALENLFTANPDKRIVIATFSSNVHRVQQIIDISIRHGRRVALTGRSMLNVVSAACELGYMHFPEGTLVDIGDIKRFRPSDLTLITTGSQGEPLSALARIANGEHKTIDIEEGDTVIISATPVPGNEKAVTRVINSLAKIGADVYDKSRARVHVSGHAGAEELKIVLSIVQPKSFMPVHGESTHLRAHARLAEATGVPKDNIFLCENGESLELTPRGVHRGEIVQSGIVYVDGLSVGDTSQDVLDERCALGEQGFACIAAAVSLTRHEVQGEVQVEMRGITGGDDAYLARDAEAAVKSALRKALGKNATLKEAKKASRDALLSLLWERTKQRPMVIANLLEI